MSAPDPVLILASTSAARRDLLARLELPFGVAAPHFDERTADSQFETLGPEGFVSHLARCKAEAVAARLPGRVVLAADQIAVLDGCLLTKPAHAHAAVEQLMLLRGRTHELTTGVHVYDARTATHHRGLDRHRLTMRAFDRREAAAYVERYQPLECAGSYRIEDAGIKLFDRIEGGDFTGIIGLPLLTVASLLRDIGLLG